MVCCGRNHAHYSRRGEGGLPTENECPSMLFARRMPSTLYPFFWERAVEGHRARVLASASRSERDCPFPRPTPARVVRPLDGATAAERACWSNFRSLRLFRRTGVNALTDHSVEEGRGPFEVYVQLARVQKVPLGVIGTLPFAVSPLSCF